jgi:hypothetical protein
MVLAALLFCLLFSLKGCEDYGFLLVNNENPIMSVSLFPAADKYEAARYDQGYEAIFHCRTMQANRKIASLLISEKSPPCL